MRFCIVGTPSPLTQESIDAFKDLHGLDSPESIVSWIGVYLRDHSETLNEVERRSISAFKILLGEDGFRDLLLKIFSGNDIAVNVGGSGNSGDVDIIIDGETYIELLAFLGWLANILGIVGFFQSLSNPTNEDLQRLENKMEMNREQMDKLQAAFDKSQRENDDKAKNEAIEEAAELQEQFEDALEQIQEQHRESSGYYDEDEQEDN